MATPSERQTIFIDNEISKRTIDSYFADLETNGNGVKSNNCFKELRFFHLIGSQPPDLMHDFLEGALLYNFKCLLEYLLERKILSVEHIFKRFQKFEYGRNDSQNKVPCTLFNKKNFKVSNLKMSASAMWTLIRVFPLMFGLLLKEDDRFLHFCFLIEIFRKLNGRFFTEERITNIEHEIMSYLEMFVQLYPTKNITAKQHFIIHYGHAIRQFGPPFTYSTMRYESKHSFFKEIYHMTKNRKNLSKTLAFKHQRLQLFYLMSPNYVIDSIIGSRRSDNDLEVIEAILNEEHIECIKDIKFKGILYKLNDIIYHRGFKRIVKIILTRTSAELFVDQFEDVEYLPHFTGFSLQETERINTAIKLEDLENIHPIDLYYVRNMKIVVPKFPID